MANLYADIPVDLPQELTEILLATTQVRGERIVSRGHVSPDNFWYEQATHEWILVLQGAACLQIKGKDCDVQMQAGDYLNLPTGCRHRVSWTDPNQDTVWLAVHYQPD